MDATTAPGMPDGSPAYLELGLDELRNRAQRAVEGLADCRFCPRDCGVNRLEDKWSAGATPDQIADMALELQRKGCHNINFVTPEHVVPQVLEAVAEAVGRGLTLPIVYNTSAYDCVESLELMDGVVDIYMPDFKFWSEDRSRHYMKAADYPEVAREAIREMHRQVGPLRTDEDGLATRGLIVRHLVMPGMVDETREILTWLAEELGPDTYVNLMDQYYPDGKVPGGDRYAEIDRGIRPEEFREARRFAREAGLRLDRRRPLKPRRLKRRTLPTH